MPVSLIVRGLEINDPLERAFDSSLTKDSCFVLVKWTLDVSKSVMKSHFLKMKK